MKIEDLRLITAFKGHKKGDVTALRYDSDWNALMPIVEKCYHNGEDENNLMGDITHALLDCNIDATYEAVVNFIKWYNEK